MQKRWQKETSHMNGISFMRGAQFRAQSRIALKGTALNIALVTFVSLSVVLGAWLAYGRTHTMTLPEEDMVVARFDRPASTTDHSVFRNQKEPKQEQWIESRISRVRTSSHGKIKALKLNYRVNGEGSWNGWALRLGEQDWSPYLNGSLIFRMCGRKNSLPPFKVELKTSGKSSRVYTTRLLASRTHLDVVKKEGIVDYRLSLRSLTGGEELANVRELVFVFENHALPQRSHAGSVFLHSVRLSQSSSKLPEILTFTPLDKEDKEEVDMILKGLAERAFAWFQASRDPKSGLVLDRRRNHKIDNTGRKLCSIASLGYYLSILPAAQREGLISKEGAEANILQSLESILRLPHHHGLFYHFYDSDGKVSPNSEISILDSSILFNGLMCVSQAYKGQIHTLSERILNRADWTQFIQKGEKILLSMGLKDGQLLHSMDVRSSEFAMGLFLAVGSETHPVDPEIYYNTRIDRGELAGFSVLNPGHGLFTSYYGLGWHRTEGLVDRDNVDFEANAKQSALANRCFAREWALSKTYAPENGGWWGISAGDSEKGYIPAAPLKGNAEGTVWPTTALAALPWIESTIGSDLLAWKASRSWDKVVGDYGIAPFNLETEWIAKDLIAIDLGSFYLGWVDVYQEGYVRDLWMAHPIARRAFDLLEFQEK